MSNKRSILVIGGSAGSLTKVLQLLPYFKKEMELAIVIVFHRKDTDDTTLVDVLSKRTEWKVKEAEEKEVIRPGVIYIAPTDYHLLIEKDLTLSLDYSEKINYCRPSIDATFESAADAVGESLVGLLLSGANEDGTKGLKAIKKCGGLVVVQDPATAEVSFMPRRAIENVPVDLILQENRSEELISLLINHSREML